MKREGLCQGKRESDTCQQGEAENSKCTEQVWSPAAPMWARDPRRPRPPMWSDDRPPVE